MLVLAFCMDNTILFNLMACLSSSLLKLDSGLRKLVKIINIQNLWCSCQLLTVRKYNTNLYKESRQWWGHTGHWWWAFDTVHSMPLLALHLIQPKDNLSSRQPGARLRALSSGLVHRSAIPENTFIENMDLKWLHLVNFWCQLSALLTSMQLIDINSQNSCTFFPKSQSL